MFRRSRQHIAQSSGVSSVTIRRLPLKMLVKTTVILASVVATLPMVAFVGTVRMPSVRQRVPSVPPRSRLQVSNMCFGHCLTEDGTWEMSTEGVLIDGDEDHATKVWSLFQNQFRAASQVGTFFNGPIGEEDIKYRWRRLRNMLDISSDEAVQIMEADSSPLVIDANHVQKTYDAMVEASSRDEALAIIKMHPGVVASGDQIRDDIYGARVVGVLVESTRPFFDAVKGVMR